MEPGDWPQGLWKRLIIKHFGHTFDREKTRKLKIIFSWRNLRSKILKSENCEIFEIKKIEIFPKENSMKIENFDF